MVAEIPGAELRAGAQGLFEAGTGEELRGDGAAKHVPASRGIADLIERRWMYRRRRNELGADRVSGEVRRASFAERDAQRGAALAQRVRGDGEGVGPQLAHLVLVQLHHSEAAEPRGRLGQGARHTHAVRFFSEEQAVQIRIHESGKAAPQQLRGLEIHLVSGNEVDVERIEVLDQRSQLDALYINFISGYEMNLETA